MRVSLRKRFFFIQLPLLVLLVLFLGSAIRSQVRSARELEHLAQEVTQALYAARFAREFERSGKKYLDNLLTDRRPDVASAARLDQITEEWRRYIASRGRSLDPGDAALFDEAATQLARVRESQARILQVAAGGGAEKSRRALLRQELLPLLDGAPLAALERNASLRAAEAAALIPELSGRIGSFGILSAESLRTTLGDLRLDIEGAVRAELVGRAVARYVRGFSEVVVSGEEGAVAGAAAARRKAEEQLSAWKAAAAAQRDRGSRRLREVAATEAVEVGLLRLDAAGAEIVALSRRGATREATRRLVGEVTPLAAALLEQIEAAAAGEDDGIREALEAVASDSRRKKAEVAIAGVLLVGIAAGSLLLLFRRTVTPVLTLKEMADRVAAGELGAKVNIASGDEVGDLARSFNAMTDYLARATVSREYFDNILQAILSSVFVVGPDGSVRTVNAATWRMLGYEQEELVGRPATAIFATDEEAQREWFDEIVRRGEVTNAEKICRGKEGYEIPVLCSASVIRDAEGEVDGIVFVAQDITDRIASEKALQEAHDSLKVWVGELERRNRDITLLNRLGDHLQTCLSVDEAYAVIPETASQLFPGSSGALGIIHPSRNVVENLASWGPRNAAEPVFDPEACWGLRRGRPHLLEAGGSAVPCGHIQPPIPARAICIPLMGAGETIGVLQIRYDGGGDPEHAAAIFTEPVQALAVTLAGTVAMAINNLRLRSTLREQVIRDALTGLFNRRYMEESLIREVLRAKRTNSRIGVIMIDLDFFKSINDTHGHAAGDMVLREFGRYLKLRIRGSDLACRYGGEEFTLVLPDCPAEVAVTRAEQIRAGMAQEIALEHQGRPVGPVTVSIGVAFFPEHGRTADEVIRAADAALYRAKADGRDRVMVAGAPEPHPA